MHKSIAFMIASTSVAFLSSNLMAQPYCLYDATGEDRTDGYGVGVARFGDINADGFDDIAISDSWDTHPKGGPWVDRYTIFFGNDGPPLNQQIVLSAEDEIVHDIGYGLSIAGLGDIDGDSFPDWVIGAPLWNNEAGRVYLHSSLLGVELPFASGGVITEHMGLEVSWVGDMNGDGLMEFAFSREYPTNSIWVYGMVGGSFVEFDRIEPLNGGAVGDIRSYTGLGDINGDGYGDFAYVEWFMHSRDELHLLMGGASIGGWTEFVFDRDVVLISKLGDVDRNGLDDFGLGDRVFGFNPDSLDIYEIGNLSDKGIIVDGGLNFDPSCHSSFITDDLDVSNSEIVRTYPETCFTVDSISSHDDATHRRTA